MALKKWNADSVPFETFRMAEQDWLTVIPPIDMDFDLSKREFRDAVRLRYDWPI